MSRTSVQLNNLGKFDTQGAFTNDDRSGGMNENSGARCFTCAIGRSVALGLWLLMPLPPWGQPVRSAEPGPPAGQRVQLGALDLRPLAGKVVCVYNLSSW